MFNNHMVTSPDQAATKKKSITYNCPKHPDEILKIYCQKCEEVICQDCVVYSHQQHAYDLQLAKEAASDIKGKLKEMVVTTKGKLEKFTSYSETVAKSEKHITTYPDDLKGAISGKFDKLITELTQRKEELLSSVDTHYDGFSKQLWADKNKVEMSILGFNAGINFSNKVMEGRDDVETAVLGTQALRQLKQLHQKEWDPDVVKQFGPVVLLENSSGSQDVDHSGYIGSIGGLHNIGTTTTCSTPPILEIKALGYDGYFTRPHRFSHTLVINEHFNCSVEFSNVPVSAFPQAELKHNVTCNGKAIDDEDVLLLETEDWNVSTLQIMTREAGTYSVCASLEFMAMTVATASLELKFFQFKFKKREKL